MRRRDSKIGSLTLLRRAMLRRGKLTARQIPSGRFGMA